MGKIKVAVLASGRGSNFQALIDGMKSGEVNAEILVMITDNPEAKAIERAKSAQIPYEIIERSKFKSREEMDLKICELLHKYGAELVVLAGYMRILKAKKLFEDFKYRIINIHPSLLPAFSGTTHAQKDAFEYGAKISGLTIHFVTEDVDAGPVIYQKAVDISKCGTAEEVSSEILRHEHKAYKLVVDSFSKGRYVVEGRRVNYILF